MRAIATVIKSQPLRFQRLHAAMASMSLVALLSMMCGPMAHGALIGAGYSLVISSSDRVLAALETSMQQQIIADEMCDSPHLRVRARNKPALKLTNDSNAASTAPLSSFTIDIESNDYLFGSGDTPFDAFQQFISVSPFSDASVQITESSLNADKTALTVNFSGLTAGKSVIFNVDLDAINAAMFPFPDFRSVLFGAPMNHGGSPTAPANTMARFVDPGSTPSSRDVSQQLTQLTSVPAYANERLRPYYTMDPIDILTVKTSTLVPEPATWLAGLSALCSTLLVRRRS